MTVIPSFPYISAKILGSAKGDPKATGPSIPREISLQSHPSEMTCKTCSVGFVAASQETLKLLLF
jgi:hypothetical protein